MALKFTRNLFVKPANDLSVVCSDSDLQCSRFSAFSFEVMKVNLLVLGLHNVGDNWDPNVSLY